MYPVWSHAYEHRMMTSYTCDDVSRGKLTSNQKASIRKSINGITFRFEGETLYELNSDTQFKLTPVEVACCIYTSRESKRTSWSVSFSIDGELYKYENPTVGSITYSPITVKNEWFDKVFPNFEYKGKTKPAEPALGMDESLYVLDALDVDILDVLDVEETLSKPNLNYITDLNPHTVGIVRDLIKHIGQDYTFSWKGDTYNMKDPPTGVKEFLLFYSRWKNEQEIEAKTVTFYQEYTVLPPEAKDLVKRIQVFINTIKSYEEDRAKSPIDFNSISIQSAPSTDDLGEQIRTSLPDDTYGIKCIQADDLGDNARYRLFRNNNNLQMVTTDSEGMFIRTSEDKSAAYVSQILDYDTDVLDMGYDKKFKEKKAKDYIWAKKDSKTMVSSEAECSNFTEYEQAEPNGKKDWGFTEKFQPDTHQLHSLKFAGEKILLGHRPGFGKTINSILLAEKMRNSLCTCEEDTCVCDLPDIYILAPDRKLVKHWVDEVKRMSDIDTKHYIWSTYKHLELSQAKTEYPEYHHLDPEELTDLKNGGAIRHQYYKKTQKEMRHCMVCDRGYRKGYFEDDEKKVAYDTVKHILYGGSNDKTVLEFHWRLVEDKIFFSCGECIGKHFITGFTVSDEGVKYDNFKDHEKNGGLGIGEYLYRESKVWEKFYNEVKEIAGIEDDTKSIKEIKQKLRDENSQIPQNLKLSYKMQKKMNWHMYRAPPCILICDEIHKFVRESKSLVMQVLWKYILSCQFTVLASATPVESAGSELTQLYLMSEMLRTKRQFWLDEPVRFNMKFNGRFLPPWHLLRPLEKGENMYVVAARMKNKFSRFNTVPNIQDAIQGLVAQSNVIDKQIDTKFTLNYTKLMSMYIGSDLTPNQWVSNGEYGQDSYKITKDGYKMFVNAALSKLYVLQASKSRGQKEFPDLVPATENGYIEVPMDLIRALLLDRPPKSELRYLITQNEYNKYTYRVTVHGLSDFIVEKGDDFDANAILFLEKCILANKLGDNLFTITYKDPLKTVETGSALITNYTDSTGVLPYSPFRGRDEGKKLTNFLKKSKIQIPEGIKGLKWLHVCPTRQQTSALKSQNFYDNIPYIPDLLGSKVMKIVTTIEEQVAKGKNVMVYHDKVEMLRMCHRALAMRKHIWVNKDIDNARLEQGIDPVNAEAGDYVFNEKLKGLAIKRAKKRWIKLTDEEMKTQNDAYNYVETPERSEDIDFDRYQEAFDLLVSVAKRSIYPVIFKDYENKFGKNSVIDTIKLVRSLNDFAFYAEYAFNQPTNEVLQANHTRCKKLIDGCEDMKHITTGKIDFERKTKILSAIDTYLEIKDMEKIEFIQIVYDACEPYYLRAFQQVVTKRPEIKQIYNPARYEKVWKLKEDFRWTNHKKGNKQETYHYWRTLKPVPETNKDLYVVEDGEIVMEYVEKQNPTGNKYIMLETDKYVFKVNNASLRKAISQKVQSDIDENKSDEDIFREIPIDKEVTNVPDWPVELGGEIRKRCIDYYLNKNWKGHVFNSSFKQTKKENLVKNRPFMKYSKGITDNIKAPKGLPTDVFPMPTISLPEYTSFDFKTIETFIENNPLMYKDLFFGQDNAGKVGNLGEEYKIKSGLTFEQIELPKAYLKKKFTREIKTYTDAMVFCIWTQMYLRYQWVQNLMVRNKQTVLLPTKDRIDSIEEYERVLIHMDSNPFKSKSKQQGKIFFNDVEMKGRDTFLQEMKPRITGMSSNNRLTFAIVDSNSVPATDTPKYVQAFSEGYVDCLFVSESGIVGVDYKSCSPSYMICIDPVVSAGKQDQFNGRTVRRKSHRYLPERLRKVEYVSFVSKGIEIKNTKEDEKEEINYTLTSLGKRIKESEEPKKSEYIREYRKMKRQTWAEKQRKRALTDLEELREDLRKVLDLIDDDTEKFKDDAQQIVNNYDGPLLQKIIEKEREIQILSSEDNVRQKYKAFTGVYASFAQQEPENEFPPTDVVIGSITEEEVKKEAIPNNPDTISETELRALLTKQEILFSQQQYTEAMETLNYRWSYDDFIHDPGINQLREKLNCGEITYARQRERNIDTDPCEDVSNDPLKSEREPDNKRWNTYFDNYVNISHVPVYNNYAFLSVEEYQASVSKYSEEKYDNYYCYACNRTTPVNSVTCTHCGFAVRDEKEQFLYYHLVPSETIIQQSTAQFLKSESKNMKNKNKSAYRRIQRDRLEMVLSLNSIEHQVKHNGDKTYKFEYNTEKEPNKKTFYKRVKKDILEEEKGGDWYRIMTKPDKDIYKAMCKKYTEQEPDRFKGTVDEAKPFQIQQKKRIKPTVSDFEVGHKVKYNGEIWFIMRVEGDNITIEQNGETKDVDRKDLTIPEESDDDKDEDYTDSDSDVSIEEEY